MDQRHIVAIVLHRNRKIGIPVRIGRGIWDAWGRDCRARDLWSGVQSPRYQNGYSGVQSSEVAKTYDRRTETRFLGNLVYDYATIYIVVQSLVAVWITCTHDTRPVCRAFSIDPLSHLFNPIHRAGEPGSSV